MSDKDETVVDFSTARRPHVYARSEGKVKAIRKRFRDARNEAVSEKSPARNKNNKNNKKAKKRKKGKSKKK